MNYEIINAEDKKGQLDGDQLYKQLKRKITKRINKAYSMPLQFTNPMLANTYLIYFSSIDKWLAKEGYRMNADGNSYEITIDYTK